MKFLDKIGFKIYGKDKLDKQIKKMEDYVEYKIEYQSPNNGKNIDEKEDIEIGGDDEKQKLLDA